MRRLAQWAETPSRVQSAECRVQSARERALRPPRWASDRAPGATHGLGALGVRLGRCGLARGALPLGELIAQFLPLELELGALLVHADLEELLHARYR